MAHFEFVTLWRLNAPLAPTWQAIYDYELWPAWWRGVERVVVTREGRADRVGAVAQQVWKSRLPYRLRFQIEITRVEPMRLIEVKADGELRGVGAMQFATAHEETHVQFDWNVDTTRPWMNALAPALAPLFRWNHGVIMDWGAECLARRLNVALVGTQQH